MNLYLVLAIALGAISGVVEAPVVRPVTTASQRDCRVERRIIRIARKAMDRGSALLAFFEPRPEARGPRPEGAARPRAPAIA